MKLMKYHFNMTHKEQLQTIEWKLKAYQVKRRDNFTCQICGRKTNLNAHHVAYEKHLMLWQYPENYYITLCETCHLYEHSIIDGKIKHIKEMLLSGMMGIDIFRKLKNKEYFNDGVPF